MLKQKLDKGKNHLLLKEGISLAILMYKTNSKPLS